MKVADHHCRVAEFDGNPFRATATSVDPIREWFLRAPSIDRVRYVNDDGQRVQVDRPRAPIVVRSLRSVGGCRGWQNKANRAR